MFKDLQQYNFLDNDFTLYKSQIDTKAKFHLDLGGYHQIVMLGSEKEIKIACLRESSFVILSSCEKFSVFSSYSSDRI